MATILRRRSRGRREEFAELVGLSRVGTVHQIDQSDGGQCPRHNVVKSLKLPHRHSREGGKPDRKEQLDARLHGHDVF